MNIDRRNFIKICFSILADCGCSGAGARNLHDIQGCILQTGDLELLGVNKSDFGTLDSKTLLDTSGNPQLDRALGRALVRLSKQFEVNPSFAFYSEIGSPNAYASAESQVPGTSGAVVFGKTLFRKLLANNDQGISVIAIAAHEFGHIIQYNKGIQGVLRGGERTVRKIELHADYLSGWYLGLRKMEDPNISLYSSGKTFNEIGDFQYNNPDHHGTPKERVDAAEAGFSLAQQGVRDISSAVRAGQKYVHNL